MILASTTIVNSPPSSTVNWGGLFDYILRALQYFCDWLFGWIDYLSSSFDAFIFQSIPKTLGLDSILTPALMDLVSSWVPISFICHCFFVYWIAAGYIWAFNWLLGFVPGES